MSVLGAHELGESLRRTRFHEPTRRESIRGGLKTKDDKEDMEYYGHIQYTQFAVSYIACVFVVILLSAVLDIRCCFLQITHYYTIILEEECITSRHRRIRYLGTTESSRARFGKDAIGLDRFSMFSEGHRSWVLCNERAAMPCLL